MSSEPMDHEDLLRRVLREGLGRDDAAIERDVARYRSEAGSGVLDRAVAELDHYFEGEVDDPVAAAELTTERPLERLTRRLREVLDQTAAAIFQAPAARPVYLSGGRPRSVPLSFRIPDSLGASTGLARIVEGEFDPASGTVTLDLTRTRGRGRVSLGLLRDDIISEPLVAELGQRVTLAWPSQDPPAELVMAVTR